jgi:hypothetical protein
MIGALPQRFLVLALGFHSLPNHPTDAGKLKRRAIKATHPKVVSDDP